MPPQSPSPPPSKPQSTNILTRALLTTPFLLLSAAAFLHMDILGMMRRPSPSATGKITWDSGSVDILPRFHYLSFLDDIYRDVTVGFAPSAFGYDPVSWWQAFVFLQDVGLLHCVWLLESSREGVWESGGRGVWL